MARPGQPSALGKSWTKLRPDFIAATTDCGGYLLLWIGVLAAHFIKLFVEYLGVDSEIINKVSFLETWTWIASFVCFFVRIVFRAVRAIFRKFDE
jgi:hypothetical protein